MSTIRDPAYITNAGRTMMTAGGEVTYTKAVLYGQDISGLSDSQIKALTSLGNPLREVKIGVSNKQSSDSGSTVILEAVFQNSDLKTDLQYKAVGFFARKNDMEQLVIVAVANQGAYLAATNPDGVATDALDLKIAVKIGDATSVTAVIDPAGSVTPATLNGAINKLDHDLTAQIETKADSTDLDKTNAEVAKKADSESVKSQVDAVNNSITDLSNTVQSNKDATDKALATKADQTAVNDQISKQVTMINTVLDTKITADYSYSKAELDKKLLALSTGTSGKVDANQVATMIEGKADKTDLDNEIKAVTDLANTKANTIDVDSKIKTVTDLANTKANSADVYTKTETDNQINKFDLSKVKFRKQFLNSDGDKVDKTWSATKNDDSTYTIDLYNDDWTAAKLADVLVQLPNKADTSTVNAQIADAKNTIKSNVDNLQSAINTKTNASDVYTKKQVDDAFSSRDATIANKADKSYVDDKVDAIDFSKIKFRKQYVTGNNKTADSTWQATKNADGTYTIDLYYDDWTAQRVVDLLNQIGSKANASDVNSMQKLINQQNQTIQSLASRLNNAENEIRYIKANYVEGRTFPASQEAQANSWENENPQRIAFITK